MNTKFRHEIRNGKIKLRWSASLLLLKVKYMLEFDPDVRRNIMNQNQLSKEHRNSVGTTILFSNAHLVIIKEKNKRKGCKVIKLYDFHFWLYSKFSKRRKTSDSGCKSYNLF